MVEVDAQAERLDDAAAAPDHFEQAVGRAPRQVAGPKLVDRRPEREVLRAVRVAQHHVGPAIHELSRVLARGCVHTQLAAGHGDADGVWTAGREVRRQIRHPRGGFGLAVHDEELEARAPRRGARTAQRARLACARPPASGTAGSATPCRRIRCDRAVRTCAVRPRCLLRPASGPAARTTGPLPTSP